ncbi:hypothetical protein MHB42_04030 [Lysinibacillus sp. FSL K6-0232]
MMIISLIMPLTEVHAAATLEVKATAGISGKAKHQTALPLQVTIKNNGEDFSGDMAINAAYSYEIASAYVVPIDLAAGEEKTFTFYLDGTNYGYNSGDLLAFYRGGIEKGEKVEYKGTKQLQTNTLDPTSIFIYTLTDKSDRLSGYLQLTSFAPQNDLEVFHLNQLENYTFPENAQGLAMANIIVVDEVAIADLTQKQQEALLGWVQDGGTLLLGGAEQVNATAGIFQQYLPLSLSPEMTTVTAETLTKLTGGGTFTQPASMYTATNNEGSTPVLTDNDTILASKTKVGSGEIVQTAFSLGDQPLASMDGYTALIAKVVNLQSISQQGAMMQGQPPLERMSYELRDVNELFPSFEVSVSYMLIVIILYILIIGPVLYIVLKKMDKREHAWWIIPSLSIVISIALFIIGAKDRIVQPQVQQTAFYKVNEDSSVNGYYLASILTNRSGNFVVQADQQTTAVATRKSIDMTGNMSSLQDHSYIKEHANGSTLTLRDLSYWSVQSFGGKTSAQNIGKMDIDITLKNNKLTGTVKNNFPFTLKDVTLISGTKEVNLGDIQANDTLQVNKEFKTTILQSPATFNNYNYSYPRKKDEVDPLRIERMKSLAVSLVANDKQPALIAWADQTITGVELETSANMSPITMLIQPFKGNNELSGPFTMKRNNFTYTVNSLSTSGYADQIDGELNQWHLSEGAHEVTITMPEQFMASVETLNELTIANKDVQYMQLSLWNNETNAYEPLVDTKQVLTEQISTYFNAEGELRIEVQYRQNPAGGPTKLPDIELKGVAK